MSPTPRNRTQKPADRVEGAVLGGASDAASAVSSSVEASVAAVALAGATGVTAAGAPTIPAANPFAAASACFAASFAVAENRIRNAGW